jgi:predicted rRNA methylase YqxC with S4 and FtsJ domains
MCPDIVETKLKLERERKWNPDPQMINKWTVLFNLQKDYLSRIKPALDGMKNYNGVFNEKIKKQKLEKENLENLIQFQNKINADLSSRDVIKNTKFDSDEKICDDEELKYKSNKIVAAVKPQINVSKANIANKRI